MRLAYGTYIPSDPGTPAALRDEIRLAEDAGFDAIYFSEHHLAEGFPPDPLSAAIYALGQTTTMRAGAMPLLLPIHEPVRIAERAAMANFLSNGRLVLGVGAGYHETDFAQVGIALEDRGSRMDEALAVLRATWQDGPAEFRGRHFKLSQSAALKHRWAGGAPQLWICSGSQIGMRRAVRWGDAVMLSGLITGEEIRSGVLTYRKMCEESGIKPGPVGCIRRAWLTSGDESERFLQRFMDQLESHVGYSTHSDHEWVKSLRSAERRWVQDVVFVGEPNRVAEELHAWAARIGIDYVVVKFHWGRDRDFESLPHQLRRAKVLCSRINQLH